MKQILERAGQDTRHFYIKELLFKYYLIVISILKAKSSGGKLD
jgi:hypothetical protein